MDIPISIRAAGVDEATFIEHIDELAEEAFDDQCTPANPRYPLVKEIKEMLENAFYEKEKQITHKK